MLKTVQAMESREASEAETFEVTDQLEEAEIVCEGCAGTLTYTEFILRC